MRIPSSSSRSSDRPDVAMTPMIDVVFLLLVFFVWTASFQIVEQLLPSRLSTAAGTGDTSQADLDMEDFERVVVRIEQQGLDVRWWVNDVGMDRLDSGKEHLTQVASVRTDVPLLIDPADAVPLSNVMDVYDISRLLGFGDIQFAVSLPL